jgi:GxxExxY protein
LKDAVQVECGHRLDLLVDDAVIVEIKAVESLAPIHETQLLSYLGLADCKVSLPINLNVKSLKHGIKRLANQTF